MPSPPSYVPPEVVDLFVRLSFAIRQAGHPHYSARAILHRIRWHFEIDRGRRGFKCNNNWTPGLSRWLMEEYPEMDGFFLVRENSPHDMRMD
ncbi:MAG TPA: hypothetical protein VF077_03780 [Nitrospiraceae bacterium]